MPDKSQGQSVHKAASIPFVVHDARDGSMQNRDCYSNYSQALPPVCLPSVYLTLPHMTRSPRPSPSAFAYCKYWRWERTRMRLSLTHDDTIADDMDSTLLWLMVTDCGLTFTNVWWHQSPGASICQKVNVVQLSVCGGNQRLCYSCTFDLYKCLRKRASCLQEAETLWELSAGMV